MALLAPTGRSGMTEPTARAAEAQPHPLVRCALTPLGAACLFLRRTPIKRLLEREAGDSRNPKHGVRDGLRRCGGAELRAHTRGAPRGAGLRDAGRTRRAQGAHRPGATAGRRGGGSRHGTGRACRARRESRAALGVVREQRAHPLGSAGHRVGCRAPGRRRGRRPRPPRGREARPRARRRCGRGGHHGRPGRDRRCAGDGGNPARRLRSAARGALDRDAYQRREHDRRSGRRRRRGRGGLGGRARARGGCLPRRGRARRFVPGRRHVPHRLRGSGFAPWTALAVLYGATLGTGALAVVAVRWPAVGPPAVLLALAGVLYIAPRWLYEELRLFDRGAFLPLLETRVLHNHVVHVLYDAGAVAGAFLLSRALAGGPPGGGVPLWPVIGIVIAATLVGFKLAGLYQIGRAH